jgi:ABC-2 type transport system permease protein
MRELLELFRAEVRRSVTLFVRYPSEAITAFVMVTAVFLGIFLGAQSIVGVDAANLGTGLEDAVISYLLWTLSLFVLGGMAWGIQTEAQTGILEQIFLAPFGPVLVFLFRAIADLVTQSVLVLAAMGIIIAVTRVQLHFSPMVIFPLFTLMLGTYGLGFLLAGMTLLFKRAQNVIQLSQGVIFVLVFIPVEKWPALAGKLGGFVPLAPSAGVLRLLMATSSTGGAGNALTPELAAIALINGVLYFGLGMLLFVVADREARKRGLLGGY